MIAVIAQCLGALIHIIHTYYTTIAFIFQHVHFVMLHIQAMAVLKPQVPSCQVSIWYKQCTNVTMVPVSLWYTLKLWKSSKFWLMWKKSADDLCHLLHSALRTNTPSPTKSSFNCALNNNNNNNNPHIRLFNLTYFQLNCVLLTQDGTTCACNHENPLLSLSYWLNCYVENVSLKRVHLTVFSPRLKPRHDLKTR